MNRKGQFFIISAVMILLTLYSIISALNINWQTDVSEVRGSETAGIFNNVASGIDSTIRASDATNLKQNLDTFMNVERNAIGDGYALYGFFNVSAMNVTANLTLSSKTFYAEKLMSFTQG